MKNLHNPEDIVIINFSLNQSESKEKMIKKMVILLSLSYFFSITYKTFCAALNK